MLPRSFFLAKYSYMSRRIAFKASALIVVLFTAARRQSSVWTAFGNATPHVTLAGVTGAVVSAAGAGAVAATGTTETFVGTPFVASTHASALSLAEREASCA